jgi:16S rRNA (guanine1516-N2)-methyltransferase
MNREQNPLKLEITDQGLTLGGILVDFELLSQKFKMMPLSQQPLLKVVGSVKEFPRVLDTTAGYCKDAFLLAMKGHQVLALEQNLLIYELVQNGIQRAAGKISSLSRLQHEPANSFERLEQMDQGDFDVIYVDPMYPQRDTSALPKKEIQLLRALLKTQEKSFEDVDKETAEFIQLAVTKAGKKVILKRPLWAPTLMKPVGTLKGKLSRFDIYQAL